MIYDKEGYLQLNAKSAAGAIPIPEINMRIYGTDSMNSGIEYSLFTDRNGQSKILTLPAPNIAYSLQPDSPEIGYATYNVEAYGEGFYPKKLFNIAIFPDVKSVINLEMIPNGGLTQNVRPPLADNVSIIYENEELK